MWKKERPTVVTPEHVEAEERLIAGGTPELTAAFHAAWAWTIGGLDGARTDGFVATIGVLVFHAGELVGMVLDGGGGGLGRRVFELRKKVRPTTDVRVKS